MNRKFLPCAHLLSSLFSFKSMNTYSITCRNTDFTYLFAKLVRECVYLQLSPCSTYTLTPLSPCVHICLFCVFILFVWKKVKSPFQKDMHANILEREHNDKLQWNRDRRNVFGKRHISLFTFSLSLAAWLANKKGSGV